MLAINDHEEKGGMLPVFNVGFMELLLVLLVAFLVVGPKDLPKVARWLAKQVKAVRKFIKDVKQETGWDEFSKELKDVKADVQETVKDVDIRKDLQEAADTVKGEVAGVTNEVNKVKKELE